MRYFKRNVYLPTCGSWQPVDKSACGQEEFIENLNDNDHSQIQGQTATVFKSSCNHPSEHI